MIVLGAALLLLQSAAVDISVRPSVSSPGVPVARFQGFELSSRSEVWTPQSSQSTGPLEGRSPTSLPQAESQAEAEAASHSGWRPPSISLDFQLRNPIDRALNILKPQAEPSIQPSNPELERLFVGDSHSLVAKAVGSAEGTRTADGGYTSAYRGHSDPGNGVWNLGTFSYQHGAASPEEADRKQLQRLWRQATELRNRAAKAGISLGLEEELNGIDLANQSPLAALGRPDGYPGYIAWLTEAYQKGLTGRDAILWARMQGYWDVRRQRWNAPGLGNTEPSIRRDQHRRMQAIAQAIEASSQASIPAPSGILASDPPDSGAHASSEPSLSEPSLSESTPGETAETLWTPAPTPPPQASSPRDPGNPALSF